LSASIVLLLVLSGGRKEAKRWRNTVLTRGGVNRFMSLQVELEHYRNVLIVRLRGELDHHTADVVRLRMEDAILRGNSEHVILSLKELVFMDSSGLGVILGRYKQIKAKGGKMAVCDVNPSVFRLFELSGLFKILEIHENERKALTSLEVVS
jgi:stage II sporulation protein AA (anti-sigma F factor antagonist)